jgi:hypothetical protein
MGRCSNDLSRVKLKNTFNMSDQVYIRWLEMTLFAAYKRKKGHFQPNTRQSYGNPGPKGVILGSFLDPLLGQSGLKRPLNLKKGVPKRGQKGAILGPGTPGPRIWGSQDLSDPGVPGSKGPFWALFGGLFGPPFGPKWPKTPLKP